MEANVTKSDAGWARFRERTQGGVIARRTRTTFNPRLARARRERMLSERGGKQAPVTQEARCFKKVDGEYVEV